MITRYLGTQGQAAVVRFRVHSPPSVDRIWFWVYCTKIPQNPIFYLLRGGCRV